MTEALTTRRDALTAFLDHAAGTPIYTRCFEPGDFEPVRVGTTGNLRADEADLLLDRYYTCGLAVIELGEDPEPESVTRLAAALDLGEPFVPPMYRAAGMGSLFGAAGVNVLAARASAGEHESHPAFEAANGQELHSDGTLQEIGVVKTSVLLCRTPAAEGGESTIFNAVGAFVSLARENVAAAEALMSDCLRRTATYGTERASHLGPAFAIRDGGLVSRYSVTATDSWESANGDGDTLASACLFMRELATPSSGYFASFTLGPRQGLILANDKVSHGRTTYRDDGERVRTMFRGLFLKRPRRLVGET